MGEYNVADYRRVLPIPSNNMTFVQAGACNSAVLTMHDAIITNGLLKGPNHSHTGCYKWSWFNGASDSKIPWSKNNIW